MDKMAFPWTKPLRSCPFIRRGSCCIRALLSFDLAQRRENMHEYEPSHSWPGRMTTGKSYFRSNRTTMRTSRDPRTMTSLMNDQAGSIQPSTKGTHGLIPLRHASLFPTARNASRAARVGGWMTSTNVARVIVCCIF